MPLYNNAAMVSFTRTLICRFLGRHPLIYAGVLSCSFSAWNNLFVYFGGHLTLNVLPLNFMCVVGMALAIHYLVEWSFLRKLKDALTNRIYQAEKVQNNNMNRLSNVNKSVLTNSGESKPLIGTDAESLLELILNIPIKAYNALFTPMGRKNLYYFLKRSRVNLNPDYRRDGTMVYSLKNRSHFVLHRDNDLSELVFLEGAYEPLETLIVANTVHQDDVVLDLGANVGYYTVLLDRLVKPDGQVHSFEPGEGTFTKLEATKKLLKLDRSVLYAKAVANSAGHVDFWSSTSGSDAQQKTVKNVATERHVRYNRVEATTLDTFMSELNAKGVRNIAFVKCDIEGAEPSVLKGAQSLLNSQDPPIWLIEHNRMALLEHGASSLDLLAHFENCDVYFVPLCWPPSIMASTQARLWNGIPDELPDECNLVVFPKRGAYARRVVMLREAGLIP